MTLNPPAVEKRGYRLQRTALNFSSVRRICLACLFTGFNLLLLTGCQSVAGNSSSGGSGVLTPNPAQVGFGSIQVGSTSTKSETVTNTGGTTVNISQANVTG